MSPQDEHDDDLEPEVNDTAEIETENYPEEEEVAERAEPRQHPEPDVNDENEGEEESEPSDSI